ncbi:glycosyltransferase family 4 protein [Reichenbachiella agarivorans]|uniref:Glycosyltransferase family 4 protein n=1 Tax=Reichenbachiella agarivorans TaxID=2979464 RepID=A0ABY6CXG0_9BACT|nr:glycosyltransferase family 4 protein [Reichenbachiella agarivorans]UXP32925.1 glycosyltransferase family 4 protein [Reichenbachiella agarivorans]
MPKRVLFLTPYPQDTAGSQRFRFEQYIAYLEEQGIVVDRQSFIDEQTWKILYLPGHTLQKFVGIIKGFARRKWMLLRAIQYDYVFVHREAAPLGPPVFEWFLAKILSRKLIYDFDDAIWKENTTGANSLAAKMKWASKVASICKWSYKVSAGNEFLATYARQFNDHVFVNPTTLDTAYLHLPDHSSTKTNVTVGWTGTHSTLKYLDLIEEVVNELQQELPFEFLIIADQRPDSGIQGFQYLPWDKESEVADLNRIDIGVMPLEMDEWAKGKCGFKALQFMALERPVLVTPIGVNAEIVEHGVSGYHCQSREEWKQQLKVLIQDESLRQQMGIRGREKVVADFSVCSNKDNFLRLFS